MKVKEGSGCRCCRVRRLFQEGPLGLRLRNVDIQEEIGGGGGGGVLLYVGPLFNFYS